MNTPSKTDNTGNTATEFSSLEHCIGWGKGERQGIFLKEHPEITDNYKYCVAVPRTLVQD